MNLSTSYLDMVYNVALFNARMTYAAEQFARLKKALNVDTIAFRGTSGAAYAYPLAYLTGTRLCCVRKVNSESAHCTFPLEGYGDMSRYAIIDDQIDTGNTMKVIDEAIRTEAKKAYVPVPKLVFIGLYAVMSLWHETFLGAPCISLHPDSSSSVNGIQDLINSSNRRAAQEYSNAVSIGCERT